MIEMLEKYKNKLEKVKSICKDKIDIYELKTKSELERSIS